MSDDIEARKRELVNILIKKNVLVSNEFLESLKNEITNEQLEELKCYFESNDDYLITAKIEQILSRKQAFDNKVSIIDMYTDSNKKKTVQDFVNYFLSRYKAIEKMLSGRQDLKNIASIARVRAKKDKDTVSIIGLVSEKETTKNNNIILTIEDPTGSIKVLVNKNKQELFDEVKDVCLDEIIAVVGVNSENIVFANNILWPEVPLNKELKKCDEEVYAVFIGDIHIGSKLFLKEDFEKFINWINGKLGSNAQLDTIKKIKYLFIAGDVIEGIGIYPGQEHHLDIDDIYKQYDAFIEYIKMIPNTVTIIICAGNHDALRISEPQPPLKREFANELYNLPNVVLVPSPSTINIHRSEKFSGFDVLLYHGYSFPYYADNVESIRASGRLTRADLIMKYLLKRRHLAPAHTSTLYMPEPSRDPLLIDKVPDFFVTGHIHRVSALNYRSITLLNCSCWMSQTPEQEKRGIEPQPSRAFLVNLQTREVKILNFLTEK